MSRAALPVDEAERLEVLHGLGLLDTPPEERFDRISRIAASLFDVPVAFLSLLDSDRLWLKSCLGLTDRDHARSDSVCATTVLQGAPLVVPDLAADPRFRDLPGVRDGGLRFYAGQPLRVKGRVVGTLCLVDVRTRALSDELLARFDDLARWAEDELGSVELVDALTAERETARELAGLQQRDELVLAAAETGVLVTDAVGRLTVVNPAAQRMLGTTAAALVGRDLHAELHGPTDEALHTREACPVQRALDERVPQRVAADVLVRADGQRIDVEWTAAPLVIDGVVTGAVVTVDDISTRRAVERMKDEFISVVSHELRTPLTSIRGSLGLLASGRFGDLPDKAARLLEIAASNTDRLVRLVNDILDLERIESGAVEVDMRVQRLEPVLEAARDAVSGTAEAAGVPLVVEPTDLEASVDADLLVQALTNLLGNAVKFSHAGVPVTLRARAGDGEVHLDVVDQGRGIPAERLTRIFERFEQVDASDARDKGGTGLGLAIVRSLAVRMGGTVSVTSAPGAGSTFSFTLPALTAEGATRPVVLVEDDADLLEVMLQALRSHGIDAVPARTEEQAVDLVTRLRPRLVLLDVELAQGSGFGVAARLRQDPELARTPCVVATVHDLDETSRARLRLGPTRFVRKGRGDEDVVQVVVEVVRSQQEETA